MVDDFFSSFPVFWLPISALFSQFSSSFSRAESSAKRVKTTHVSSKLQRFHFSVFFLIRKLFPQRAHFESSQLGSLDSSLMNSTSSYASAEKQMRERKIHNRITSSEGEINYVSSPSEAKFKIEFIASLKQHRRANHQKEEEKMIQNFQLGWAKGASNEASSSINPHCARLDSSHSIKFHFSSNYPIISSRREGNEVWVASKWSFSQLVRRVNLHQWNPRRQST